MNSRRIGRWIRSGARGTLASLLAVGLSLSSAVAARAADDVQDANQLVEKAKLTVEQFQKDPNMEGFRELAKKAHGMLILPQMIRGLSRPEAKKRAIELLGYLGLQNRLTHRPAELSGGEQQRVAIARAVANAPRALLADEPTGNLDPHTADHVFKALMQLVKATRVAMLIATHNMELAGRMDRRVSLVDGKVVEME